MTSVSVAKLNEMIKRASRHTLGDLLTRSVARYPTKQAFVFNDRVVTYEQFDHLVNQTAHGLKARGIQKGDRLAILSKNNLDFVIITFALARMGAVLIPVNYMLTEKDIQYILEHAEAVGYFAEETYLNVIDGAAKDLNITHRIAIETDHVDHDGWDTLINVQHNESTHLYEETLHDEDLAQILYTSGTESAPKGVMLSHKSITSEYVSCVVDGNMSSDDVLVHALPFYHSAQIHVFLGPSIYLGASGIILDEANPEIIMETIEKHAANQLFAPPTVWIALLRHPKFDSFNLDSLEKCYYGAAIMPREIIRELTDRLPNGQLYNFYGQTEVAPLATALQPHDQLRKLGSAGKATLNVETKIVDENGIEVPRGDTGEIVHRTPHAMLGYLDDPEQTAKAFRNGWFHSGDLGTMDEDGYITIVDRKNDIINTGGINVASREVEEVIYLMDEVAEVAVIGISDDYWIEAIAAVITTKDDYTLTEEQVIEFCKTELTAFKCPKHVYFRETLPKNPSGKVLKKDLRDEYGK